MNRALHHVWEKGQASLFDWLRDNLTRGGYAIIWEPAWPEERIALRDPSRKAMSFQNLTAHVQGNHLLHPREIIAALERVGMKAQAHLFAGGNEAVIVVQR